MSRVVDELLAPRLEQLEGGDVVRRIWARDPTVWSANPDAPELRDRLGWLMVEAWLRGRLDDLVPFAAETRRDFDRIVLLGMGGSSLAPDVVWRCFGRQSDGPTFDMLDSTHPDAVARVADRTDGRTLFIVSSKSGTTVETAGFLAYFWELTKGNGAQFVGVTDAGTPLEKLANERGFRRVFLNPADVGGRYSALSYVGMVPAALIGVDVLRLLNRAQPMIEACRQPARENPGMQLGALMGECALRGRNKLTLVSSPQLLSFGLWMEQLVAESTGKAGKGIVPVVNEACRGGMPEASDDRVYVQSSLGGTRDSGIVVSLRSLEDAGHPVLKLPLDDRYDLGAEFFRWAFATAVAGHVLGVNPFDQPNVAESKRNTERVLRDGGGGGVAAADAQALTAFFDGVRPGDYVALLAYHAPSPSADRRFAAVQTAVRKRLGVPVTVGYGPRYLHSTGQLHKGGPAVGHFIQVVDAPARDLAIPEAGYTFGELIAAQAAGDYEALAARGRPVVRVHDLAALEAALK